MEKKLYSKESKEKTALKNAYKWTLEDRENQKQTLIIPFDCFELLAIFLNCCSFFFYLI